MSRIERGGSNASLDAIEVLANALSVEPWQLLAPGPSEDNDSGTVGFHTQPMVPVFTPVWRAPVMVRLA